jgi:DNA-binding transcriptional MerR regulator
MGTNGGFTEEELKHEKTEVFSAVSRSILENPIANRRMFMRVTRLHLELLKDLKSSGVNPRECTELMKAMYLDFPPLSAEVENNDALYSIGNRNNAARIAIRASRLAILNENRKQVVTRAALLEEKAKRAAQENKKGAEEPGENEWEVVDGMDELNSSASGMDMAA